MKKPKVLMVIDAPNWAYDQMASYIIDELGHKYDFSKLIAHYHKKKELKDLRYKIKQPFRFFKALRHESFKRGEKYDIVVYLWWYLPNIVGIDLSFKHELRGIFTESFPPGRTVEFSGTEQEFIDSYLKPSNGIVAGNKNILDFYSKYDLPVYYATGATDIQKFGFNKKKRDDYEFRVCWTGNPDRNFKGFYEFVEPAVKLAQKQRPNIKLITRFSGPLETLPEFYSEVDVMVNASIGDAGPGFLIDAGGCGIPSISTDVGFASELITDYHNGLIVEREIKKIANKIIELNDNRDLLEKMSRNIARDVSQYWNHSYRAKFWDDMFERVLSEGEMV